jgi:hypothetical protein
LEKKQNQRKKRRKQKKRIKIILLSLIPIIVILLVFFNYRNNQTLLIKSESYTEYASVTYYIFKDYTYINTENIAEENRNIDENEKANNSQQIINGNLNVDSEWISNNKEAINQMISEQAFEDWNQWIDSQYSTVSNDENEETMSETDETTISSETLYNYLQYIGLSEEELNAQLTWYEIISNNTDISIAGLSIPYAGYVKYSMKEEDGLFRTQILPYLSGDYFEYIEKMSTDSETENSEEQSGLKIVENSYVYAVFVMDSDDSHYLEDEITVNRDNLIDWNGLQNISEYYNLLNNRIDVVKTLPSVNFSSNDVDYSGYFINIIESGNRKYYVVMIRDSAEAFIDINQAEGNIKLDSYQVIKIPQSAVFTKDDQSYVSVVKNNGAEEELAVNIYKTVDDECILLPEENEELVDNMTIRVYP